MCVRLLKTLLVLLISLMCLAYATQNIVNLDVAYSVVGSVLGMAGHEYYPKSFFPAITAPALVWAGTWVIILTEYTAGVLAAKGALDLWKNRGADATTFNASKTYAVLGLATGMVIWFGYFGAIGGSFFQMWQTELGRMSMGDSLAMGAMCALILLFVINPDS